MALTPEDIKVSIDPLVKWAEKAIDGHLRTSRSTNTTFTCYDFPSDFRWKDTHPEIEKQLCKMYESAGWKVEHLSLKHETESDCRDTTRRLSIRYHFVEKK